MYGEMFSWEGPATLETLERSIHQAARKFDERTGLKAAVALVNPMSWPVDVTVPEGQKLKVGGMEVRKAKGVLVNHVWVGVEE